MLIAIPLSRRRTQYGYTYVMQVLPSRGFDAAQLLVVGPYSLIELSPYNAYFIVGLHYKKSNQTVLMKTLSVFIEFIANYQNVFYLK